MTLDELGSLCAITIATVIVFLTVMVIKRRKHDK